MLLCHPLHRLLAGYNPDRPVVGVNRRLADPEQSSQPHRAKNRGEEARVSSERADVHLRKVFGLESRSLTGGQVPR